MAREARAKRGRTSPKTAKRNSAAAEAAVEVKTPKPQKKNKKSRS